MKQIRSILHLINQIKSNSRVVEIETRWKKACASSHYHWFLLFYMLSLILMSLSWIQQQISQTRNLSFKVQVVNQMQALHREPLQLGGKRLMGTPNSHTQMPENVQIQAILFDSKPSDRTVLLLDNSGQVKSYRIGDQLPGGSVVMRIEPQSIVIERDGQRQQLELHQYPNNFITDEPLQPQLHIIQ